MAIPFRFKDAPSERTEFGHPDLAITLTLRTYAEDGLTRESFRRVLQWAAAIEDDLQTGAVHKAVAKRLKIARAAEGFTLDDEMIDLLWPKLCQNLQVVETFLEEFVFPNETRQFPFKVSSSAWDLAAGRLRGFQAQRTIGSFCLWGCSSMRTTW
ncbi:unnamed protein product [Durusdinium trenchii]|uniref:ubiquitinyl hydrolase 1 n=1 Tax=Durusdinium trenchii TaxID=1381693 RepID=A0ABP0LL41_9DINO